MTATIEVETDDLDAAARQTADRVAEPLTSTAAALYAALSDTGAMAGDDPAGAAWAATYDRAADSALRATSEASAGCFRLADLLAQTADNYRRADAASTLGGGADLAPRTLAEIGARQAWAPAGGGLPSAVGGSSSPPAGWWLVQHSVGYVWPNGHQDRLHAAAAAWSRSAARIDDIAVDAWFAAMPFCVDRLPEADDVLTVTHATHDQLASLAAAHRDLATGCTALAGHIDAMHAEVEGELRSLVEWSAGIQVAGGLLSLVSFGAAEVPTQGVEAGRIAATIARIAVILDRFAALVRAAAAAVGAVAERAGAVSAALRGVLGARLSAAAVELVGRSPALGALQERLALLRLNPEAGEIRLPFGDSSVDARLGSGHASRHQFPGVRRFKSQFFDSADLRELVDTRRIIGLRQDNGNLRFVLHARDDVGVDRITGMSTNIYTVIRRPNGSLVTMFPGLSVER